MDRIRADDCETIDATLVGHGAIDRQAIELPAGAATVDGSGDADGGEFPVDEVVRIVLEGTTHHARFDRFAGSVRATGVFETPAGAREPGEGTNRLEEWVASAGLDLGRTVHLDVIEPGFAYGLRAPGAPAVYDAPDAPDDSLASIAESLEES